MIPSPRLCIAKLRDHIFQKLRLDSRSSLRHEFYFHYQLMTNPYIVYNIYIYYTIWYIWYILYILYAYTYCTPNMKATLILTTFWYGYVDLAGFPSLVSAGEDGYKINILAQNTPSFWLGVKHCSKCDRSYGKVCSSIIHCEDVPWCTQSSLFDLFARG